MSSNWPPIPGIVDGMPVDADSLNPPIQQLAQRTNQLRNRLNDVIGDTPFSSVRCGSAELASGTGEPSLFDVVYLDDGGVYTAARATPSVTDEFSAANSSHAIGVLSAINGGLGTVVVSGQLLLESGGVAVELSTLVESGETFRNGPYYLSNKEAGKLTSKPGGIAVYIGYFIEDPDNPGYGGFAVLSPAVYDAGEAHAHRAYVLGMQPAGRQIATESTPSGVHKLLGFYSVATELGTDAPGDVIPRLVCLGDWFGTEPVQYTMWLSTSAGTTRGTSAPPTDFSDAYVHWTSSDGAEGSGKTRVWSFESPVEVGTKGMHVCLENSQHDWAVPYATAGWDAPYAADTDAPDKRTWVIEAPTETVGWLANVQRKYFTGEVAVDGKFSFLLIGGPWTAPHAMVSDTVRIACADIFVVDMVKPSAGDTTVIGADTYEYVDDYGDETGDNIPVLINADIEALYTYRELVSASAVGASGIHIVLDAEEEKLIIGTPDTTSVTHLGAALSTTITSIGKTVSGDISAALLVYDVEHYNLVPNAQYWVAPDIWTAQQLSNGVTILPIPYSATAEPATGYGMAEGDIWAVDISDPSKGDPYLYAIGMDKQLVEHYPPVPLGAAALVLNGVELDSQHVFGPNATYLLSYETLYWNPSTFAQVPWPYDWESINTPGEDYTQQKAVLHFVRTRVGSTGQVSSLRAEEGSPIRVINCATGMPAATGDLLVGLDLKMSSKDTGRAGFKVVKFASGNRLETGPAVERIVAGPGVTITQNADAPSGQGTVVVGLSQGEADYTGDFEEIALLNAKQEMIGMFPYVRLLGWSTGGSNTPSGFTAKFRVPHTLPDVYYRVVLYATMFGESNIAHSPGALLPNAGLQFTYSVLPDVFPIGSDNESTPPVSALNLADNLLTPDNPKVVTVEFGDPALNPAYKAYDPVLVHNNPTEPNANLTGQRQRALGNPFPNADDIAGWTQTESSLGVRPGSLVAVRFDRGDYTGTGAEYTGAIGVINLRWRLVRIA